MFKHAKAVKQNRFTYLRFSHYQIHQVMMPYSAFLLSVIPVLLLFIFADIQHFDEQLPVVIGVRVVLAIAAVLFLLILSRQYPQYLMIGEAILVMLVFFALVYIGKLALNNGDYNYQSGVMLVLVYIAALSRMTFKYALVFTTLMCISYGLVIFPVKYQFNPASELDNVSIFLSLYVITLMACLRRDSETYKSFVQFNRIRCQQLSLRKNQQILAIQNQTDPLSGLKNRLYLSSQLLPRVNHEAHCAVLMIDIDNFKKINDTYGHPVGDEVIIGVSSILKSHCDTQDRIAIRYGGEEFLVVVFGEHQSEIAKFAEQLRSDIEALVWQIQDLEVTVSIGAAYKMNLDINHYKLIEQADTALYSAKKNGKNQVSFYVRT